MFSFGAESDSEDDEGGAFPERKSHASPVLPTDEEPSPKLKNHAQLDYEAQLELLEQQNKKRLTIARRESPGPQNQEQEISWNPPIGIPKVPSGWVAQWDNSSRTFYYIQLSTGASQWNMPTTAAPPDELPNSLQANKELRISPSESPNDGSSQNPTQNSNSSSQAPVDLPGFDHWANWDDLTTKYGTGPITDALWKAIEALNLLRSDAEAQERPFLPDERIVVIARRVLVSARLERKVYFQELITQLPMCEQELLADRGVDPLSYGVVLDVFRSYRNFLARGKLYIPQLDPLDYHPDAFEAWFFSDPTPTAASASPHISSHSQEAPRSHNSSAGGTLRAHLEFAAQWQNVQQSSTKAHADSLVQQ
ncbi:uncharacterized protein BDZ99DRAFT_269212 [Mytilinidion resinicola]|uniref:WW domain-containing protein n=1 Tax=Mytilinidion resinicola TaxID=574789 RepID=A0A6A6YUU7_9PEZI|nr:uncharacterized protein BDZ99DRAFT_269212 [Mytilinidion resinicola]KAF2812551.1 hypothetical protein BDZ99DRAFT_269212 [Mytilinidion resinicola]